MTAPLDLAALAREWLDKNAARPFTARHDPKNLIELLELVRSKSHAASHAEGLEEGLGQKSPRPAILDHKWLDPECYEGGCQSLVWKRRYETAVKGRQDFRQAFREARAQGEQGVTLSELILAIGDEHVVMQNLLNSVDTIRQMKNGDTKISFFTNQITATDVAADRVKKLGLVIWLPQDRVDAAKREIAIRALIPSTPAPPTEAQGAASEDEIDWPENSPSHFVRAIGIVRTESPPFTFDEETPAPGSAAQEVERLLTIETVASIKTTNERTPIMTTDDKKTNAVLRKAKCLSIIWNTDGQKIDDDGMLGAVNDLHEAICDLYGVDPKRGFRMIGGEPEPS